MPLISGCALEEDMEPVRNPKPLFRKTCPVCFNTHPIWLYIDECGDVVGCNECLRKEYVGGSEC